MKLHILYYFIFFFGVVSTLPAQVVIQPKQLNQEPKGIIYNEEWNVNFKIHTNGWGLGFDWGTIDAFDKASFYSVSLDFISHPKEFRQNLRPTFYNTLTRPYAYGKRNSFFSLKGALGKKIYFTEKSRRKGVAIGLSYQGGLSLGVLKPYYLEIRFLESGAPIVEDVKYTEENRELFLDQQNIEGASSFFRGLGESSIIAGLHGKIALKFDWGAYDEFVKSLDIGLMAEIYPREIPIMLNTVNRPYFFNAYVNVQFGRRK